MQMSDSPQITGEKFDHKIAAIFATSNDAHIAAESVRDSMELEQRQVIVINPGDAHPGRELEPDSKGILQTLIRSHLWLGAFGALAGLILFIATYASGIGFVVNNAVPAFLLMIVYCAVMGLLLAGLVSLRPDHAPYLIKAQNALKEGKSVITIHASSQEQMQQASDELEKHSAQVIHSL
ncbi:MAG: hypothetical protein EA348_02945 [Pseudomonadaceae bacterium]|nr:MAG: hypothetical protein EA348_02945 [Pseudomonadaceae bacterium]